MPRALIKTLTYSLMHLAVAITVAYVLTGDLAIALGIGMIEPLVQTVAYSIHERIWERWLPGKSVPVASIHACETTMTRISETFESTHLPNTA